MGEPRALEPIESVQVGSLICACGMCGHGIIFEFEALNEETGRVNPEHDFIDCPECGNACDAQAATFNAIIQYEQSDG